jgi:hypothetical protein
LETKGGYTIKPYLNPSGEIVLRVEGRRPKAVIQNKGQQSSKHRNAVGNEQDRDGSVSQRFRKNRDTLKEADSLRDQLIREDSNAETRTHLVETELTLDQVKDAETAYRMLSPLPPPDWTNSGWDLVKSVNFILTNFKPCKNVKPLTAAIAAYLEMKDKDCNRRASTLAGLALSLKRLDAACPGKSVHQVTEEELRPLIRRGEKLSSMKRLKSVYVNFFKWCAGKERCWTNHNPAQDVELPERTDETGVPQIVPVAAVQSLLTAALKFKGGRLFLFCVDAFACALRPSELGRIQALLKILGRSSFHFGDKPEDNYIDVVGKPRKRRKVNIPMEFVPFIRVFVEAGYPIIPRNFFNDWTHLRAIVGYLGSVSYLPPGSDPTKLIPWVDDYPRHTGGTHHLNRYENEWKTALWMGNTPKMIFNYYNGLATKSETTEFYKIPTALELPTGEDLRAAGIPDGATDAELRKLCCPVDRANTFGMEKGEFQKARAAYLEQHPQAAIPERKGFTRGNGLWTKRRMLDLPGKREDLIRLVWTNKIEDLATQHKVVRSTMARAIADRTIPAPPKGYWQKRAAGKDVELPDEVAKLFPEKLPAYCAPVGRPARIDWPPLAEFFHLLWEKSITEIAEQLRTTNDHVVRRSQTLGLERPGHSHWHRKPERREIPDRIKYLLRLPPEQLGAELAKTKEFETKAPAGKQSANSGHSIL